jgi:hypothetical protein
MRCWHGANPDDLTAEIDGNSRYRVITQRVGVLARQWLIFATLWHTQTSIGACHGLYRDEAVMPLGRIALHAIVPPALIPLAKHQAARLATAHL